MSVLSCARLPATAAAAAAAAIVAALAFGGKANADDTPAAAEAVKPILDWRMRYEGVDDDAFSSRARAVTSRLRAGVETRPWHATSLLAEGVWVAAPVEDYDSTTNGRAAYPVVADPAGFAALNRLALTNEALPRVTLTLGRQRINLDDTRFVGSVAWRQNEQTFDALRAEFAGAGLSADVTYARRINRIFGPDSPAGTWHGDVLLANVSHGFGFGRLTAFDYRLDLDEAPAASTNTLGVRLVGKHALGRIAASYGLSYAEQTDAGANAADFAVHYGLLQGGLQIGKLGLVLGRETLSSDGTHAFQTPLATLHAFQGWADKFLATPARGVADTYLKLGRPLAHAAVFEAATLRGELHDFRADRGSAHYGTEVDVALVATRKRLSMTLKVADYSADALAADTRKLWLETDYRF